MSPVSDDTVLVTNPHLFFERRDGHWIAIHCENARRFRLSSDALQLLDAFGEPMNIRSALGDPTGAASGLVGLLVQHDLLLVVSSHQPYRAWGKAELLVQVGASRGPRRRSDAVASPSTAPAAIALNQAPPRENDFVDVLDKRRSERCYGNERLSIDDLGALLWLSARVRAKLGKGNNLGPSHRAAPSAGGLHSLELYVLIADVAGANAGLYQYDPYSHQLEGRQEWCPAFDLEMHRLAVVPARLSRRPDTLILITSVVDRTMKKYGPPGFLSIYRDVGALMQTLYLVAAHLGLAACALAGVDHLGEFDIGSDRHAMEEVHVGGFVLGCPVEGGRP